MPSLLLPETETVNRAQHRIASANQRRPKSYMRHTARRVRGWGCHAEIIARPCPKNMSKLPTWRPRPPVVLPELLLRRAPPGAPKAIAGVGAVDLREPEPHVLFPPTDQRRVGHRGRHHCPVPGAAGKLVIGVVGPHRKIQGQHREVASDEAVCHGVEIDVPRPVHDGPFAGVDGGPVDHRVAG